MRNIKLEAWVERYWYPKIPQRSMFDDPFRVHRRYVKLFDMDLVSTRASDTFRKHWTIKTGTQQERLLCRLNAQTNNGFRTRNSRETRNSFRIHLVKLLCYNVRLHSAWCTYAAQDVVLCCGSSASLVSCVFVCGWGAAEVHAEAQLSPNPKGQHLRSRHTRPPKRTCRDGPEHLGPTHLAFLGSRRAGCVRPSYARLLPY